MGGINLYKIGKSLSHFIKNVVNDLRPGKMGGNMIIFGYISTVFSQEALSGNEFPKKDEYKKYIVTL